MQKLKGISRFRLFTLDKLRRPVFWFLVVVQPVCYGVQLVIRLNKISCHQKPIV